jgi:WD40 repeat protein
MVASFDCRSPYDPAAYAAAALEERLEETRTVYANVFFGVGVGAAANGYLACGSSTGAISVFNVDHLLAGGPENDVAPALVLPAHEGAVYSLVVHAEEGILCSGGDDGRTAVWRVDALVAAADDDDETKKKNVRPAAAFVNPQRGLPRGAQSAIPETNAVAYDGSRGVLFAAAGDGVCYGWDVREARSSPAASLRGHATGKPLHCAVASSGGGASGTVVTGSEDGTARIWDVRRETATHVVNPYAATSVSRHSEEASDVEASDGKKPPANERRWVGCVALDGAENWCAMGSGGGTVTMWSFAAGACASRVTAGRGTAMQAVKLTGEHVVAAGSEPHVFRWNLAGKLISRQPCGPASVFALDAARAMTAVGGVGATVEIFSALGTKVATAKCA